jgi:CheY-like chemotaxis protein
MPVEHGLFTVAELRRGYPRLGIIVCSFHVDQATQDRARAHGADAYLTKPISPRTLNATLASLDLAESDQSWQDDPDEAETLKAMT